MEYAQEIAKLAQGIIEYKNYEMLVQILVDYDRLKKKEESIDNEDKPFWTIGGKHGI